MAYSVPAVQVNQVLNNPGGAAASTPDLQAVIVGPLYNVVRADITDEAAAVRSKVAGFDNFIYNTSGTSNVISLPMPSHVLGQKLVDSSVVFVLKNAYVKVNDFTANLSTFATADPSATTVVTATGPCYAFTATAPDGNLTIKVGDRLKYTVTVNSTATPKVTSVRSVSGSSVTLAQAVCATSDIAAGQTAVVFSVYRPVAVLTLAPTTGQKRLTAANTDYTIGINADISAWPTSSPIYHTIDLVESFHLGYRALRVDQSQTILDIETELDRESRLGEASHDNPLSLGVQVAKANTGGIVRALSIAEDNYDGYLAAIDLLGSDFNVYAMVPLSMEDTVQQLFAAHAQSMSVPSLGGWRVALVSTAVPAKDFVIGNDVAKASAYVRQVTTGTKTYIIDPDVDFLASGVVPTDIVEITTFTTDVNHTVPTGSVAADFIGTWEVVAVIDSNRIEVEWVGGTYTFRTTTTGQSNGQFIPYYIYRTITKANQAKYVAEVSSTFASNRVWNIMPDSVSLMVNGVETPNLPGYYLCCAHAGKVAGEAVQQGFTNGTVAGIADLQHSNNYFSRTNLNDMVNTGTCLYVQAVAGGTPYCRHALTTDVSVLEYREQLKVKNWDFLSYYYKSKLTPFIGHWNITPEMLNTVRATIISASELLLTQKLPKIGPPLLSYQIVTLAQNTVNKDRVTIKIRIEIVSPANYFDVELEI